MTILTSFSSSVYHAQIRSSLDRGFKKIYSGTSTESERSAARNLVQKYFGVCTASTVSEVHDPAEIHSLIGNFMDSPQRKQVYRIWTFEP